MTQTSEEVVSDIRRKEAAQKDTSQRGAGTGEDAVATRGRQYNETVPGAFPAVISPNPAQQATMAAAAEEENAKILSAQAEADKKPAMVPHSSVSAPLADKAKDKK